MFNFIFRTKPTQSPTFTPSPSPSQDSLPEEVLINILSRLTYDDLRTIRHTSKQFQRLSMDQRVLEGCIHRSWPHLSSLDRRLFAQNPIVKFQQVKNFENFQPVHQSSLLTGGATCYQHAIVGNELIGIFNLELRKGDLYDDTRLARLPVASYGVCFDSDKDWYYLATADHINKVHKTERHPTIRLYTTNALISTLALRGNSLYVAESDPLGRNGGSVVQINTENGHKSADFSAGGVVTHIALDESRLFIGGDMTGSLHIWNLKTKEHTSHKIQNSAIWTFRVYGDSVLTGYANGTVIFSSLSSDHALKTFSGHREAVRYLCWLGGDRLVTAAIDNTLKVWCFEKTTCLKTVQLQRNDLTRQVVPTFSSSLNTMCITTTDACTRLYHFDPRLQEQEFTWLDRIFWPLPSSE